MRELGQAKYYPFKDGHILKLNEQTINRTEYDNEFGENVVRRVKESGFNVNGWLGHWNSNPTKAKLLFSQESFRVEDGYIMADGYVRHDEDTHEILENVKANFQTHIPVSIASRVMGYREEAIPNSSHTKVIFTDGHLMRIDACDVASSKFCGVIPDFTKPLDSIPDRFSTSEESAGSQSDSEKSFVIKEGAPLDSAFLEGLKSDMPEVKQEAAQPHNEVEKQDNTNTPKEQESATEAAPAAPEAQPEETKESQKMEKQEEQNPVVADAKESAGDLSSVFDQDVKIQKQAEYDLFMLDRSKKAHDTRLESFKRGAGNVYSADGVQEISSMLDIMLESAAKAKGVAPHQLTDRDVTAYAQEARQRYMNHGAISNSGSTASRLESAQGSTNLLSPNYRLADSIIEELNKTSRFKGRFDGVKWESVVKDPQVRTMLIKAMQNNGEGIKAASELYHTALESFQNIVEPARLQLESHGRYSEDLNLETVSTLRQIAGVKVESSPMDDEYQGSPTVYVELDSCVPTIITALCIYVNPLLKILKKMTNNRVVRHSYNICRPDNATLIVQDLEIKIGESVEVETNGILSVGVVDNSTTPATVVSLSDSYAMDYMTFQSDTQGVMSLMVIQPDLYTDYGDGETITIRIETMPKMDVCDVPIFIEVSRTNEYVSGEHLRIAVPYCQEALSAFINNYKVNVVDEAFEVATYMVDQYWSDLLMSKIRHAANACFAAEVQQAQANAIATGTPFLVPERIMPCWNASSVPLFDDDNNTNGSFATFMHTAHSLRHKCNGITDGANNIVIPVELRDLLAGWSISGDVRNQAGNMLSGADSQVTMIANMNVITVGNCTIEDITYTDASGDEVTVSVYMGMVYLLGDSALWGQISNTQVKEEGTIGRVTTYVCDDDPEGLSKRQIVAPTGRKLKGFSSYGRFYANPDSITSFKVVIPLAASNSCGMVRTPRISQVSR